MKLASLFAMSALLCEEANENPSAGGAPAVEPPKADDDQKLTIGQRLSAAIASKATLQASIAERDTTIAEHATTIERLTGELATANTALAAANEKITALEADAAVVDKALKASEAETAGLKAKESTAEKKAQETVASLGFPAAALPAAQDSEAQSESVAELREKLATTKDPAAKAELVAKIRERRFSDATSLN